MSALAQVLTIGHTCAGSCSCSKTDEYPYIDRNPDCLVEGHAGPITSVAFSPDGTRVASFSHDSLVKIWHAATGALVSESGPLKVVHLSRHKWPKMMRASALLSVSSLMGCGVCGEVGGMFRRCFEPW